MTSGSPLLLVTASPPGGHGVGELYMRSIASLVDKPLVVIALDPAKGKPRPEGAHLTLHLARRYEPAFRPVGGVLGAATAAAGAVAVLALFADIHDRMRQLGFAYRGNVEQFISKDKSSVLYADAIFENTRAKRSNV